MHNLKAIGKLFTVDGELQSVTPYGNGHINDTYLATYKQGDSLERFIHQRINHEVFHNPPALMSNFEQVIAHIGQKLQEEEIADRDRRVLALVKSRNGRSYSTDDQGNYWRTSPFIHNTFTADVVTKPQQLWAAGWAFGHFQKQLSDLPPDTIIETIPNFHNTRWRFDMLQTAVSADPCNRAQLAKKEIAFAQTHEHIVDTLLNLNAQGQIPTRIIHNDTKINNLLFDVTTGEAVCVTDLDTVMPGLALYDFGDLVRSAVSLSAEDEPNTALVHADIERFRQLANGYLTATTGLLNRVEREHLVLASQLITFETGLRFLTDYLNGDTYFKIHHPNHNLERARNQFKLVSSMEAQADKMYAIIENWQRPIYPEHVTSPHYLYNP